MKPVPQGSIFKKRDFKNAPPPSDKERRKFALKSAETALNAGYNYIIVAPLRTRISYDTKQVVTGGGIHAAEKVRRDYNHRVESVQDCIAIDDLAALHLIWQDSLPRKLTKNNEHFELMDVREFIEFFDSGNALVSRPQTPKIHDSNYKKVGDRERIAAQIPVMTAAATCRLNLRPQSLELFKRNPQSRDTAEERKCLESHRTAAASVKWTDFPLNIADKKNTLETKGYTLNRPKISGPVGGGQRQTVDTDVWGEGWTDLSSNLNSSTGEFLYHRRLRAYLLASDILDETAMIDHAVFVTSGHSFEETEGVFLFPERPGIGLKDITSKYKSKFESVERSILQKQKKAEQKKEREISGNVRSFESKIEYKQEDISRLESHISEMRQQDDEAMIAQTKATMAAFPDAKFDENAMRKQLRAVRETNIQAQERKLAKLRSELSALQIQSPEAPRPSTTTISQAERKPSQTVTDSTGLKGLYHAFETFQNVLIISASELSSTSSCSESYLLCADKLQAYNAIGPRLGKAGFTPLTAPTGYKPYENR